MHAMWVKAIAAAVLAGAAPLALAQAPVEVLRSERSARGILKLGNGIHRLGQPIKRDARVQMVHVVVADIAREPVHEG